MELRLTEEDASYNSCILSKGCLPSQPRQFGLPNIKWGKKLLCNVRPDALLIAVTFSLEYIYWR
jgi:hypothetical protein